MAIIPSLLSRARRSLACDLRFAARYFSRHAATTTILVAVIALGTGTNAIVFSIVQSQFFRPAPAVPDNDAGSLIWAQERATQTAEWRPRRLSAPEFVALAERRDVFADVAAWTEEEITFQAGDSTDSRLVGAQFVTPNFFRTLGVPLAAGSGFHDETGDVPDLTAVVAHEVAERSFGNARAAVGRRVLLNGIPVYIVGVAPSRFQGAKRGMDNSAVWIPMSARADIVRLPRGQRQTENVMTLVTRLAPGVSRDQATALTRTVVTNALPDSAARVGMARSAYVLPMHALPPGDDRTEDVFVFAFFMTMGVLVLLVAWTNVSSLIVAAALGRRHEIAVRLSLGASRMRIVMQLVTESTVLALAGSALGFLMAWWGLTWLATTGVLGTDLAPDPWTFVYVLATALVTGIGFGLSPALNATRGGIATAMRESGTGARDRSRDQRRFVALQIALSQPMLVLLGVVLSQLISDYRPLPPEFSQKAIMIGLRPSPTGAMPQGRDEIAGLVARLAERPDVVGAAPDPAVFGVREVHTRETVARVRIETTAPGWLGLVDVPVTLGRDVALADTAALDFPVVIGSDLARRLWNDASPIGRTLTSPRGATAKDSIALTVVGVFDAAHELPDMARDRGIARVDAPARVFTAAGDLRRGRRVLVRTRGPAASMLPDLRRFVRVQAPSLPVASMRTLEQADAEAFRAAWRKSAMAAGASALPLLLASLGLFGIVSLAVRQRTREIGIRIAVGARPMQVARTFLASGVFVTLAALALGLPLSVAVVKLGLSPVFTPEGDPFVVGIGVAAVQMAVACAASWIPARRAALVDPATTLRVD